MLRSALFQPVDIASLVVFRIGFGLIMLWEVWRYWTHGWIERYFIQPGYFFKYYGFEWVQPWDGNGMYIHFFVLGVLAFLVVVGLFYRVAMILFTLGFGYVFLLDQTRYLNHFYLVILVSILMCVLPANRAFSIDALLRSSLRSNTIPAWTVWSLRIQFEILYVFAGIVKINPDWLRLEPLSLWLAKRTDFPVIGYLFVETWVVAIAAYGVILLHIIGGPLLLWPRTRIWVFSLYVIFHTMNHFLFSIGIFPWFTLFATLIFFESDWPRRLKATAFSVVDKLKGDARSATGTPMRYVAEGCASMNLSGYGIKQRMIIGLLALWLAFQILIPLRHLLYPGNVSWTEEGHRFAWQMKLRSKKGEAIFTIKDPFTNKSWETLPTLYLTRKQVRKMTCRPDMVLQFAHHLADIWAKEKGHPNVEVHANVKCSLNRRRRALLLDPERDLAKEKRTLGHADWILPLKEPLQRSPQEAIRE